MPFHGGTPAVGIGAPGVALSGVEDLTNGELRDDAQTSPNVIAVKTCVFTSSDLRTWPSV
jgi:hypothetical protein